MIVNGLVGATKLIKIGGAYIIASSIKRGQRMRAEVKQLIAGTIVTKLMFIGGLTETYTIDAPFIVGTASQVDGHTLLNNQVANALLRSGATLPVLESATITISAEEGKVNMTLRSDANPANNNVFEIEDLDSSYLPNDCLNPTKAGNVPARIANFLDFRVNLAGFSYYIIDARIEVKVKIVDKFFVQGDPGLNTVANQFPYLMITGFEIRGGGKAAVLMDSVNGAYNSSNISGSTVNFDNTGTGTNLTLQIPGYTRTVANDFVIDVYDDPAGNGTGTWRNLFVPFGATNPLFNMTRSVVTRSDLDITPGLITCDFEFECYIN